MRFLGFKIIDIYIIKKFLGTYFFAILLIISIAVVFDISEKIEDFIEKEAPLRAIVFDYYMNFIPYFANLFSSLFTFIAVIFFTSKMAYNTEIIAILSNGVSFRRMLYPYFISALVIALFNFALLAYIIPPANAERLDFTYKYIKNPIRNTDKNIHRQIEPGLFIYMKSYNTTNDVGYKFSMEHFNDDGDLQSKLMSDYVKWDSTQNNWTIRNYYIREIDGLNENIITGTTMDTALNMKPEEFKRIAQFTETMNIHELNNYIEDQRMQGADVISLLIDKYSRVAYPFSTFILTLIGVSLSSRKIRGGIGMHIGFGLLLSFSYILFMRFSTMFAVNGTMNPLFAVWFPNLVYAIISLFLYRLAPK